ncbi:hypothetical protein SCHPADRAFT_212457 [Schizopora paradoxa]|uniref:Uncharacterized protein n=1 Tax=Schizopora paradoxa TaxID=27342 RepID=A0A0H2RWN4_9AGAM|nr:hypothetical protein SCHPADRAFT_212457 [Schizopora paradoxa]
MVLCTRTYAAWAGNKCVLATLLSAIGTAYPVYRFTHSTSELVNVLSWPGCIILVTDHSIFYSLIASVLIDSLALSLLLYKLAQHARMVKNIESRGGIKTKVSLLAVMVHEGIVYFLFTIICMVVNAIVLQRAPDDIRDFLVPTQSCIQNVLCARLFFRMQSTHKSEMGTSRVSAIPTDIIFADLEMGVRSRGGAEETMSTGRTYIG